MKEHSWHVTLSMMEAFTLRDPKENFFLTNGPVSENFGNISHWMLSVIIMESR